MSHEIVVLNRLSREDTYAYQKFTEIATQLCNEHSDISKNLSSTLLENFCSDAAKLKTLDLMKHLSPQNVTNILLVLEKILSNRVDSLRNKDTENELQSKVAADCMQASLTVLYILTSANMPVTVYLEDVIDEVLTCVKCVLQKATRATVKKSCGGVIHHLREAIVLLAELINIQVLTEVAVLNASSIGIASFFTEQCIELNHPAMKLLTVVFTKYQKHRRFIFNDILTSVSRFSKNNKTVQRYQLNSVENIHMFTALILHLVQGVPHFPETAVQDIENQTICDSAINDQYRTMSTVAANFISFFLDNCVMKNREANCQSLIETFIQDLLTVITKEVWPGASFLLMVLVKLLVSRLQNKTTDISLRVIALEYLGKILARLRKYTILSKENVEELDDIIENVRKQEQQQDKENLSRQEVKTDEERTYILQHVLLNYIISKDSNDEFLSHVRQFYVIEWCHEISQKEIHQPLKETSRTQGNVIARKPLSERNSGSGGKENCKHNKRKSNDKIICSRAKLQLKTLCNEVCIKKKKIGISDPAREVNACINNTSKELIIRYLISRGEFSRCFDICLKHIFYSLTENSIPLRAKAMKSLMLIVEADPSILNKPYVQKGVNCSFLDSSVSVREAAIDLIGKFIISQPGLIDVYYTMLSERILDVGVSVRKRVIRIFKDICLVCPDYNKIPEIWFSLLRRVNDEEEMDIRNFFEQRGVSATQKRNLHDSLKAPGPIPLKVHLTTTSSFFSTQASNFTLSVEQNLYHCQSSEVCPAPWLNGVQKLVISIFSEMWFTPISDPQLETKLMMKRVFNITELVSMSWNCGHDCFQQLLQCMFKPQDDGSYSKRNSQGSDDDNMLIASRQIISFLVENVLRQEEGGSFHHMSSCLKTLYMFASVQPKLLVPYIRTLEPYLMVKFQGDYSTIICVIDLLKLTVPLMEHPSEVFLAQLEEDLVKLTIKYNEFVIESCLACLSVVVKELTHNYKLITDCLLKYFGDMKDFQKCHQNNAINPVLRHYHSLLQRAIFTIGILMKYFDFTDHNTFKDLEEGITDKMFEVLLYFLKQSDDQNIQIYTLKAIGAMCVHHYDYILQPDLKSYYLHVLNADHMSIELKIQVLKNIENFLQEEELVIMNRELKWETVSQEERLEEMDYSSSGLASTIIQIFREQILSCCLHNNVSMRCAVGRVMKLTLQQGLIQPMKLVPHLICLSTDVQQSLATTAFKLLEDIEKAYPEMLFSVVYRGIHLAYTFQRLIQEKEVIRGWKEDPPKALLGPVYSIIRKNKLHRRGLASYLLKYIEQQNPDLPEVLFLCDNLAYFHYEILDEPLFIIRHIDVILSTVGYDLKKDFEEALLEPIPGPGMSEQINNENNEETDEGEEDEETLLCRVPENTSLLQKCVIGFQRCSLLLNLKQHLMLMYGIGKVKLTMYSPEKPLKDFEKLFCRRANSKYNPEFVLRKLQKDDSCEESHQALIKQYMKFKTVMLEYDDEISDNGVSKKEHSSTTYHEEKCITEVSETEEISRKTRSHDPKRKKKHKFRSEIKKRRDGRL